MAENQIEVEKDFVVTYNCHTDEYTIKSSADDPKVVEGWQVYAHGYTAVARERISENEREHIVPCAKIACMIDQGQIDRERDRSRQIETD